jgi:hypothetical protein
MRRYLTVVLPLLLLASAMSAQEAHPQNPSPREQFRQSLQTLANDSPDPCDPPSDFSLNDERERKLFSSAADVIAAGLNAPSETRSPHDRIASLLKTLEKDSAEINSSWPDDKRFHSDLLDVTPMFAVTMSVRTHLSFFAFAFAPDWGDREKNLWREIGSANDFADYDYLPTAMTLYPLHRGPSGNARFLAELEFEGCAGNTYGIVYDGREWDAKSGFDLDQIIKQEGGFGLDQTPGKPSAKDPFPSVAKLQIKGPRITIPYCWWSGIDTWDNPSMCAADTYDLSPDDVRFVSRKVNRPDLLPIAKALEYAEKHDYPAVLAYCASPRIARELVDRAMPTNFSEDVRVVRLAPGKERVYLNFDNHGFEVERRGTRWLVTKSIDP